MITSRHPAQLYVWVSAVVVLMLVSLVYSPPSPAPPWRRERGRMPPKGRRGLSNHADCARHRRGERHADRIAPANGLSRVTARPAAEARRERDPNHVVDVIHHDFDPVRVLAHCEPMRVGLPHEVSQRRVGVSPCRVTECLACCWVCRARLHAQTIAWRKRIARGIFLGVRIGPVYRGLLRHFAR